MILSRQQICSLVDVVAHHRHVAVGNGDRPVQILSHLAGAVHAKDDTTHLSVLECGVRPNVVQVILVK